jgi:hypothetical protein
MKRPLYDNVRMHDPSGSLLCTISDKKARWYVRKQLAKWQDVDEKSIRLCFQPKTVSAANRGEPGEAAVYNRSAKSNRCVVCGACNSGYMRFYVVPYCYRSCFPLLYKSHLPHDVVLLCPGCQVPAQRASQKRQARLEAPFSSSKSAQRYRIDPRVRRLRKLASALLTRPDLPPRVREQYSSEVRSMFLPLDAPGEGELTPERLRAAVDLDEKVPNPDYASPSEELVRSLLAVRSDEGSGSEGCFPGIERFVRDWRLHFVTSMQPRYMPRGWSVDHPVRCDP